MKAVPHVVPPILFLVAACTSPPQTPLTTTRDSAGITIVESAAPRWGDEAAWRLGPAFLEIGVLEGPAEYQLYRAYGAARLCDGTIVVANSGTHELRFYDGDGVFLRSVGREGGGPGEFSGTIRLLRMRGDTLLTWDRDLDRISVFSPSGEYLRSVRLGDASAPIFADGAFDNGDIVVSASGAFEPTMDNGYMRRMTRYLRYNSAGDSLNSLGEFRDSEWFVKSPETGRTIASTILLGKRTVTAVGGTSLFVGTGDDYSIHVVAAAGEVARIIRRAHSPVPVTAALFETEIQNNLALIPEESRAAARREMWDGMPRPEVIPPFDRLMVDSGGNLWVREYRLTGSDLNAWSVFDPEGVWLGDLSLPPRFGPMEVGDDYALGRHTDELDVEHLILYEIAKD